MCESVQVGKLVHALFVAASGQAAAAAAMDIAHMLLQRIASQTHVVAPSTMADAMHALCYLLMYNPRYSAALQAFFQSSLQCCMAEHFDLFPYLAVAAHCNGSCGVLAARRLLLHAMPVALDASSHPGIRQALTHAAWLAFGTAERPHRGCRCRTAMQYLLAAPARILCSLFLHGTTAPPIGNATVTIACKHMHAPGGRCVLAAMTSVGAPACHGTARIALAVSNATSDILGFQVAFDGHTCLPPPPHCRLQLGLCRKTDTCLRALASAAQQWAHADDDPDAGAGNRALHGAALRSQPHSWLLTRKQRLRPQPCWSQPSVVCSCSVPVIARQRAQLGYAAQDQRFLVFCCVEMLQRSAAAPPAHACARSTSSQEVTQDRNCMHGTLPR